VRGWQGIALLGISLFLGCAEQKSVVDQYVAAVALRELGQNELAVEKLTAVVQADPDFALAFSELGRSHEALGDHRKAAKAYRQVVELDPWCLQDWLRLARVSEQLEQYVEAAEAYVRAAELDPNDLAALMGVAECSLKTRDYVRVLAYCELVEQAGGHPQEVLLLRARAYEGQKDYEHAVQAHRRLLAMDPQNVDRYLALGAVYMKVRQYDDARGVLSSAARIWPENGRVYRYLGYCSAKLRDADKAIEMYEQSVDIDAGDWEAHRGLGVAYMLKARQTGDARWQEMAVRHWRQSLAIRPGQPKHKTLEKLIRDHSKVANPLKGLNY